MTRASSKWRRIWSRLGQLDWPVINGINTLTATLISAAGVVVAIIVALSSGGNGQSGDVESVSSARGADAVSFEITWPSVATDCAGPLIGFDLDGPTPSEIQPLIQSLEPPHYEAARQGGIVIGAGTLVVLVTNRSAKALVVTDLSFPTRNVVSGAQELAWAFNIGDGCGGPTTSDQIVLHLSKRSLVYVPAGSETEESMEADSLLDIIGRRIEPGQTWKLVITVDVCSGTYDFFPRIVLSDGTLTFTTETELDGGSFRISGQDSSVLNRYVVESSRDTGKRLEQVASSIPPKEC